MLRLNSIFNVSATRILTRRRPFTLYTDRYNEKLLRGAEARGTLQLLEEKHIGRRDDGSP
jgi:hypothetical protein